MILIDTYTGHWQKALRPACPKIGTLVRVAETPDGREWDDFNRVLASNDLDLIFEKHMPRAKVNVFKIARSPYVRF